MAFIPAQYCAKLVPKFEYPNGNVAYNVLTFNQGDTVYASALEALVDAYLQWVNDTGAALWSSSVKLVSVTATDLTQQNGIQHTEVPTTPITGGASAAVMPANVTLATTFKTGFSGRSFRGRAYWIGLAESQIVGDFVDASVAEDIRAAWETLATVVADTTWIHSVVSYVSNGAPRVTAAVTPVTAYTLFDRRVDTQRRRLT